MKQFHGVIWTLIAFCFLALIGCAHSSDRDPATADDLRSGTTSSDTNSNSETETNRNMIMDRNHGGGRQMQYNVPENLPKLQMPALSGAVTAPVLAGFAPMLVTTLAPKADGGSNVQPAYGWFVLAVGLLFALIYSVRRTNARPDDQEPQFKA